MTPKHAIRSIESLKKFADYPREVVYAKLDDGRTARILSIGRKFVSLLGVGHVLPGAIVTIWK